MTSFIAHCVANMQISMELVYMRPMAVSWVCADSDSHLKIGPNHKKRGSDCRARQAPFALITTTIYETLVLETPPY